MIYKLNRDFVFEGCYKERPVVVSKVDGFLDMSEVEFLDNQETLWVMNHWLEIYLKNKGEE